MRKSQVAEIGSEATTMIPSNSDRNARENAGRYRHKRESNLKINTKFSIKPSHTIDKSGEHHDLTLKARMATQRKHQEIISILTGVKSELQTGEQRIKSRFRPLESGANALSPTDRPWKLCQFIPTEPAPPSETTGDFGFEPYLVFSIIS
jgi:hypothetical protein